MLKRVSTLWSKRTPGYVFWRQRTLMDLESSKRSYLMTERPVPIAEIARRMTSVKAKYEETTDYHERTLLRGEYKYFTGKPCDLRASHTGDIIAFLEAGAFFGFWDVPQVDGMLEELYRRSMLEPLGVEESVHLLVCLPELRKDSSELYHHLAHTMIEHVPDLTVEECARVCVASTAQTPDDLVLSLVTALRPALRTLSPSLLVELLDTLSAVTGGRRPPPQEEELLQLLQCLREALRGVLPELTPLELAITYAGLTTAEAGEGGNAAVVKSKVHREAAECFAAKAAQVCPRSLAIYFTALTLPLLRGTALHTEPLVSRTEFPAVLSSVVMVIQSLSERIVFLLVDLTPEEMIPVLRVLLHTWNVLEWHRTQYDCSKQQDDRAALSQIKAYQRDVQLLLREVSEQLSTTLDSSSGFLSSPQLVELIQLYDAALRSAADLVRSRGERVSASSARHIPESERVVRILVDKIVPHASQFSLEELGMLLVLWNGPLLTQSEKALSAVLTELSKRSPTIGGGILLKKNSCHEETTSSGQWTLVDSVRQTLQAMCSMASTAPATLRRRQPLVEEVLLRWTAAPPHHGAA